MSLSDERIAEIIRTAKYVPKKEAIRLAIEVRKLRASQAKMVEALRVVECRNTIQLWWRDWFLTAEEHDTDKASALRDLSAALAEKHGEKG